MNTKYCNDCIDYNKSNNCCEPNWWTSLNINKLFVCPCLVLNKGKYQFKHVREILKIDPEYIKLLLQNKTEINLEREQLDFLKQQIPILLQEEIQKTEKYLTTLRNFYDNNSR